MQLIIGRHGNLGHGAFLLNNTVSQESGAVMRKMAWEKIRVRGRNR
jgi:hypothetical protein